VKSEHREESKAVPIDKKCMKVWRVNVEGGRPRESQGSYEATRAAAVAEDPQVEKATPGTCSKQL